MRGASGGVPEGLAAVAVELARAQLDAGRPLVTRAAGQSMWPSVRDGERVTVLPLGGRPPRVGDVLLVELDGHLVVHRAIRVGDAAILTKGDAVSWTDPPLAPADVLGRLAPRPWDGLVALASRSGGTLLPRLGGLARRLMARVGRG